MNVAAWAVREPIPPVVLFLALLLVGSYDFQELNIKDMPDLDFPMVSVTAVMEGPPLSSSKQK
jgi:multidrug efflux pump subunit AcrB|tara:strand:+ start:735 stop:923 length:189 start_codon:yes stop_codon:yes gene_type:complete